MDLAVVGVAASGVCKNGFCEDIRIALGAVAPTPIRVSGAESILKGQIISSELIDEAARSAMNECNPRKDSYRASPEYRRDMVYVMTSGTQSDLGSITGGQNEADNIELNGRPTSFRLNLQQPFSKTFAKTSALTAQRRLRRR
jgi:hypothetical protein